MKILPVLLLICFATLAPSAGADNSRDVARRSDEFIQLIDTMIFGNEAVRPLVEPEKVQQAYSENFSGYYRDSDPSSFSSEDLEDLFKSAGTAMFYAPGQTALRHQEQIVEILNNRGELTQPIALELQESYIRLREFEKAQSLYESYPGLQPVPQVARLAAPDNATPHSYWLQDFNRDLLVQSSSSPKSSVVVVFQPGCFFSRDAISDLKNSMSAESSDFFEQSLWLIPPDGRILGSSDLTGLDTPPSFSWGYADSAGSWSEIDLLQGVPIFYFFDENGTVVAEKTGWLRDEDQSEIQVDEIMRLFESVASSKQ